MTANVETLEKLERKMTVSVPRAEVDAEVQSRLARIARTVKMDGFRPGKVPMTVVAQQYQDSVLSEVVNDKVSQVFWKAAQEANLRVAAWTKLEEVPGANSETSAELSFNAYFEVLPEVAIPDLGQLEVEKFKAEVDESAIDKAIEILRTQSRTFNERPHQAPAQAGDRVTVDFEGKIDGEPFAGGQAEDFAFVVGEGRMLPAFEEAVPGMSFGQSKTFPLHFPDNYHSPAVAGKQADFLLTIKKIEAAQLPALDDSLAKSLRIADGTLAGLRSEIRNNLEREMSRRLLSRNKTAVMNILLDKIEVDLPQSSVNQEMQVLTEDARSEFKRMGIKDADKMPVPEDLILPQAQRRVRLGLIVEELIRANNLYATPEQVKAYLEDLAKNYEKPQEFIDWNQADQNRLNQVRAIVAENNVTNYLLSKLKITEKDINFDDLMRDK